MDYDQTFDVQLTKIEEKKEKIKKDLIRIRGLIDSKAPKEIIQGEFKDLKKWLEKEYQIYSRREYRGTNYQICYHHTILADVYIEGVKPTHTNASVNKINKAIGLALFNLRHYE